jgi:hypothetical protein
VVDAALAGVAGSDRRLQCGNRDAGVHRSADRVADHLARPGVEDRRQVDETARDRDIGEVRHPELVRAVGDKILGQVGIDRPSVVAVGRDHVSPPPLRLQAMLAHEAAQLLAVHHHALVAQRRPDRGDDGRGDPVESPEPKGRKAPKVARQIGAPRSSDPIMRRPCADREGKRVTYGNGMRREKQLDPTSPNQRGLLAALRQHAARHYSSANSSASLSITEGRCTITGVSAASTRIVDDA